MTEPAPGTIRRIDDPQAEVERLAFERQVSGGQVCGPDMDRACDQECEIGPVHCWNHHRPSHGAARRGWHDPDHCDRAWSQLGPHLPR